MKKAERTYILNRRCDRKLCEILTRNNSCRKHLFQDISMLCELTYGEHYSHGSYRVSGRRITARLVLPSCNFFNLGNHSRQVAYTVFVVHHTIALDCDQLDSTSEEVNKFCSSYLLSYRFRHNEQLLSVQHKPI